MSRIGKLPVKIPSGVTITVDHDTVKVSGPKGNLEQLLPSGIKLVIEGEIATLTRANEEKVTRSQHGLLRSLIANMVTGVTTGFEKKLEVNGVGFRINLAGSDLKMNLGYSHEVVYKMPAGVNADVQQNTITVSGISKQQVGQVADESRSLRKPDPCKSKDSK